MTTSLCTFCFHRVNRSFIRFLAKSSFQENTTLTNSIFTDFKCRSHNWGLINSLQTGRVVDVFVVEKSLSVAIWHAHMLFNPAYRRCPPENTQTYLWAQAPCSKPGLCYSIHSPAWSLTNIAFCTVAGSSDLHAAHARGLDLVQKVLERHGPGWPDA